MPKLTSLGKPTVNLAVVSLFIIYGYSFCRICDDVGGNPDSGSYLSQARSLVEGQVSTFIEDNTYIIENSRPFLGPVAYSWGTPIVFAAVWAVFGFDVPLYKMIIASGFLFVVYLLYRRGSKQPEPVFIFILPLTLLHPKILGHLNEVGSDMPYATVSIACLLLADALNLHRPITKTAEWFRMPIYAVLAAVPFAFRLNGIAVLGAIIFTVALRSLSPISKRSLIKTAVLLALMLSSFGLLAFYFDSILPGAGEWPSARPQPWMLKHFPGKVVFYWEQLERLTLLGRPYQTYAAGCFLVLTTWGLFHRRHRDAVLVAYLAFSGVIYFGLDMNAGTRYLIPLWPLLCYFFVIGVHLLSTQLARVRLKQLHWIALLLVAWHFYNQQSHLTPRRNEWHSSALRTFVEQNIELDKRILVYKKAVTPRVLYFYTRRKSYWHWNSKQVVGNDFIICRKEDAQYILAYPQCSERVFASPSLEVYRCAADGNEKPRPSWEKGLDEGLKLSIAPSTPLSTRSLAPRSAGSPHLSYRS